MNGKHTGNRRANGLWAWIRRNDGVLILGAIVIAGLQYQNAHTAALLEQLGLRISSLETRMASLETTTAASLAAFAESQRQTTEQLGLRITEAQANQNRLADQLGQRISNLEKSQERVAEQLGARIGGVEKRMTGLETRMTGMETRMTGLENSVAAIQRGQGRVAERGARTTSPERGPTGTDALSGARTPGPDEDAAEFADGMNPHLGRIEDRPGLPPPEAPG